MAEPTATVISIGTRAWRRTQESRRATVRASLVEAAAWIDAGLAGAVPLETAACSADHALSPAVREVMRSSLA